MDVSNQIIGAESGGDPNATNPNSSATGAGQFISSTWLNLINQYRPDLAAGKSPAQILALRSDPKLSAAMVQAYANHNTKVLGQAGLPTTAGNLYLAHFAGPQGAVSVLKADPSTPVSSILSPEAVAANPFLKTMNAGQLAQWAAGRLGGSQKTDAPPPVSSPQPNSQSSGGSMGGLFGTLGMLSDQFAPTDPNAPMSILPPAAQTSGASPQIGGLLGLLNGASQPQQSQQPAPQQGQSNPIPAVAPSPAPPQAPSLQLSQGTPAAQAMRAQMLAAIARSLQPGAQSA